MTGHQGFVNATRFDSTGGRLFSVSIEGSVNVWDVNRAVLLETWPCHNGPVNDLACEDEDLATAGHDGRVLVLDSQSGEARHRLRAEGRAHAVAFSGRLIACGTSTGVVQLWNRETGKPLGRLEGHADTVTCLAFLDEQTLISGSRDAVVRIWDVLARSTRRVLEGHRDWVTKVSPAARDRAVSVGEDGAVIIWICESGRPVRVHEIGRPCWGLVVDEAAGFALLGAAGLTLRLDLEGGELSELPGIGGFAARGISLHPGVSLAALGHDGSSIEIHDVNRDERLQTLPGSSAGILCGVIGARGWVTGHATGRLRFYNEDDPATSVRGHGFVAYSLCRLGATQVASGSFDGSVRIWDSLTATEIRTLDHGRTHGADGRTERHGAAL